jgi:hypothetical protein
MKALTRLLLLMTAVWIAGCAHQTRYYAPMQPDGWSAQPIPVACRFAPDADLDPDTGVPVGDDGYYLYISIDAGDWDYGTTLSFIYSFAMNPGGHSWIILESPLSRVEYGHNGNFGLEKPRYQENVYQRFQDHHPDPVAYLWETMSDGRLEIGKPDRIPTFVWRMPITKRRHQLIYGYVMNRTYDQFGVRNNNCVDMVTDAAALAGINLIHRLQLTIPKKMPGISTPGWTDPQYRILEFSTPDVLQLDLRQLAQFGIGSDVTEWYLNLKR